MPRTRASAPAVIVAIDEASLEARGQWPWPRTVTAGLMRGIAQAGPAAIGVDLLWVEPDRSAPGADAVLAQALHDNKVVLGVAGLEHRDRRFPFPPQAAPLRQSGGRDLPLRRYDGHLQSRVEIARAAAGRGLISVDSSDGVVRRVPLLARIGQVVVPALSVEMVRVAAGIPVLRLEDTGGERVTLALGDVSIPLQSDGTLRPYFGRHDPARFVSAEDVLSGKAGADVLRDKFVLVGITGLGLLDYQATPLGERIPGVEIHAQILEQVFDGVYLRRPTGAALIEAALLAALGLVFVVLVPKVRASLSALLLVAMLAGFAAAGVLAFKAGILLDVAGPALGAVIVYGTLLLATLAVLHEVQARVAGELEAARRIQMGLLPAPRSVSASEPRVSLEAALEPARTVGGDFYDCFMLDRDRLFFAIGDVSGKGLAASLFMALAKSLLKSIALRSDGDPAMILTRANAEIARDNPESFFVTAFAGVLDLRNGTLEFCNAGHEPAYLCSVTRAPERLENSHGLPLCVKQDIEYRRDRRTLLPGESICILTDGVTEAMNVKGAFYGSSRVQAALKGLVTPDAIVTGLRGDVLGFARGAEPSDDLTLLCVRWNGPAGAAAAGTVS